MAELDDNQKAQVAAWIADGASLAEVQKRLREDFGISMTYMETRFLVDDLNLRLSDKDTGHDDTQDGTPVDTLPTDAEQPAIPGNVRVTIDQVTAPHALVSGKVVFSDGQSATWMLDQLGRLALDPQTPGYRPTQQDVIAFQQELQRVAQQQGF